ncbi:hypothetical protein HK405_012601 [Cladochytrium tenue]|nr:hypothetical protein HK405_012601 [Cladochytrium tenue]
MPAILSCILARLPLPDQDINPPDLAVALGSPDLNHSARIELNQTNCSPHSMDFPIRDNRFVIPIFVGPLVFPGVPVFMHIFEPRYREMLKRCMEDAGGRFGMCLPGLPAADQAAEGAGAGGCNTGPSFTKGFSLVNPAIDGAVDVEWPASASSVCSALGLYSRGACQNYVEYGTLLKIQNCQPIEDDPPCKYSPNLPRFLVHAVGESRFRVVEKGVSAAGFNVALVERVDDLEPEDEDELADEHDRVPGVEAIEPSSLEGAEMESPMLEDDTAPFGGLRRTQASPAPRPAGRKRPCPSVSSSKSAGQTVLRAELLRGSGSGARPFAQ